MKAVLIFLFLLIFILLVFQVLVQLRNIYVKKIIELKIRPIQLKIIDMLPKVINALDNAGIKYVLYGGGLLGVYRHNNSFIPWDDDIDLAIFNEGDDFQTKISQVNDELKKYNMYLKDKFFGYAVQNNDDQAYIDLFIFSKEKDLWICNEKTRKMFKNDYFTDDMVFPIKKEMFEGIEVNVPNKGVEWLKQYYGNSCLEQGFVTYLHHSNVFEKVLIFLTGFIPFYCK